MKSCIHIISVLAVLGCVTSADRRVTGAEGGRVEIKCPYQDGYQYRVKYWCRDSCGNKDVLIRTGKADTVVTAGRFYLINSVSAKTFTVWMNRLTLQDSGVYYCGVEDWGKDTLTKIHLSVIEAPTVSTRTIFPVTGFTDTTLTNTSPHMTDSTTTVKTCNAVLRLSIGAPCVCIMILIVAGVEIVTGLGRFKVKPSSAQP
ncbi:CMRF35-like molecule 1 [Amia ocellicauda]|uniref:CMRF35-like molecule 1 n=1 Tax=Amia ocellicauda TaxID=2972642 RepID=UPI00346407F3